MAPSNVKPVVKLRRYTKKFIARQKWECETTEATVVDAMVELWMSADDQQKRDAFKSATRRRDRYDKQHSDE